MMTKPTRLSVRDIAHGVASLDFMSALESLVLRGGGMGRIAKGFWVVSDHKLLESVLVKEARLFNKDNDTIIYRLLTQRQFPGDTGGVLDGGPFTQDNQETWRQQRDVCNPYFQANKLEGVAQQTVTFLEDYMLDWRREDEVDLLDAFKQTSLHTLSYHLFGGKVAPRTTRQIATVATQYFEKMALQLMLGLMPTRNLTGWKSYEELGASFIRLIEGVIDTALRQPGKFKGTLIGDLLGAFGTKTPKGLELTHENRRLVVGTLGTMYLAGFDSTAVVATHACLALAKDPQLQERIRDELYGTFGTGMLNPAKLSELKYLQAFWQFMLHEHTAFRIIFRNVATSCKLGGHTLKEGDQLLLALHAAHQMPKSRLTIDDFLSEKPSSRVREHHMPYGMGQRKCIGAPMADIQGPLMIATIVRHQTLALSWPHGPRRRMGMTSPPVHSLVRTSRI